MEDTDRLAATIPANTLQGPHRRYVYLGHWRSWESYQLLREPMEREDVRTWPQHNARPGLNTAKATFRPGLLEQGQVWGASVLTGTR